MASIVIVTKQCYLLCDTINYIAINEVKEEDYKAGLFDPPRRKTKKKLTRKQIEAMELEKFQIVIDFVPAGGPNPNSRNSNGGQTVGINVTGRQRCLELFSHMVKQIREQIPDHRFLDSIVESFLLESQDEHHNT
jgi:hypothetical protein